jgi:hypothetical protein
MCVSGALGNIEEIKQPCRPFMGVFVGMNSDLQVPEQALLLSGLFG